jgi:invasion protein IalB
MKEAAESIHGGGVNNHNNRHLTITLPQNVHAGQVLTVGTADGTQVQVSYHYCFRSSCFLTFSHKILFIKTTIPEDMPAGAVYTFQY